MSTPRESAFRFGAEAEANGENFDAYREDLAIRYGFKAWDDVPAKIQAEAQRAFLDGKRAERGSK